MSKFTAGPWKVGSKFEVGKVSDADDQSFGMIDPVADVYGDNKEADARLIAAAPDLLEALINLKREIVLSDISNESIEKMYPFIVEAREAIAKALDQ